MAQKLVETEIPHAEWIDATAEQMLDATLDALRFENIAEWNRVRDAIIDALMTVVRP